MKNWPPPDFGDFQLDRLPVKSKPIERRPKPGTSVLVLGWFYASDRELAFVKRAYSRAGYDHVVVRPSPVAEVSKWRGWYRIISRGGLQSEAQAEASELARHFDVVHCMSGGFLSLYVLMHSGIPLRFSTLLLDSTPILPKPDAFARFARAWMLYQGQPDQLRLLRWLSPSVHLHFIQERWALGLRYIRAKHALRRLVRCRHSKQIDQWMSGPVSWALSGDYPRISRHALGTIFQGMQSREQYEPRVIFAYNPSDPFISVDDVKAAAGLARTVGLPVVEATNEAPHVKLLFTASKTFFEMLLPTPRPKGAPPELAQGAPEEAATIGDADGSLMRHDLISELIMNAQGYDAFEPMAKCLQLDDSDRCQHA